MRDVLSVGSHQFTSLVGLVTFICFGNLSNLSVNGSPSSSSSSSSSAPFLSFSREPTDTVVEAGKSARFDCSARYPGTTRQDGGNDSSVVVRWRKDDVLLGFDSRRNILSNGSLLLSNVEHSQSHRPDEGFYQCVVSLKGIGSIVSRKARLQILYISGGFAVEPQSHQLNVGDVAMLACHIPGVPRPTVRWYRYEEELTSGVQSGSQSLRYLIHSPTNEDLPNVLEIRGLQANDFSHYKCRAEQNDRIKYSSFAQLTQVSDTPSLRVVPPRFVMKPTDVVAVEGSHVFLFCGANGRDRNGVQPKLVWLRNGNTLELSSDNRYMIVGSGTLKIEPVQDADSGLYTCRATNAEDSIDTDATLTVQVPSSIVPPERVTLSVQPNTDVHLDCTVHGTPKPDVKWIKNGDVIIPSDYFQIVDGRNLRILGVVHSDAGMYQCMASNRVGSAQVSLHLAVEQSDNHGGARVAPDEGYELLPSAPLDLIVVLVSMRFITLSWSAPAVLTNASAIIGYSVSWKETHSDRERVLNTTTQEANIQQLKPATSYHFIVVAWNVHGASKHGAEITVETQPEALVPDPPSNLSAIPLSTTSVRLSWNAPLNTNGPIVTYKVHYYRVGDINDEQDMNVFETSVTLTELSKFQLYVFRLVAYNANGPGVATDEVSCRTYSDVPSLPPQNVTAEAVGSKSIVVRWEAPPEDTLNGIITGYKLRYKQVGDKVSGETITTDGSRRLYDITDLQKATEYSVRISALTVNGSGPYSPWYNVMTFFNDLDESEVPGQPTSLRVRPLTNSIVVSWTPPSNQRVMVQGYILGYGIGIPDVYRLVLDARHRYHTIKGLKSNSEYVISLKAFNKIGEGQPIYETILTREETTPEPLTPMMPPVGVKAIVLSGTTILLTWTDTSLGRNQRVADQRYYTVRYNPKLTRKPKLVNATDLNLHLEDLKPDTEYEFSIKVVKGNRQSTWSLSVFNKTREAAPTSAPRDLTLVQVEDKPTWTSLGWQPPRQTNGQVTGYLVFYTTDATQPDQDWVVEGVLGDRITTTIRDLTPETTYYFKVQARNSMGYGPMSPTVIFRTPNSNGHGGGMLDDMEDTRQFIAMNRNMKDQPSSSSSGIPPTVLWIVVSCVGCIAIIAITVGVVCYRRNIHQPQPTIDSNGSTNQKVVPNGNLKPPDLWIHDQMEMNRSSHRNSSNHGGQPIDDTTLSRTESDMDAASVDIHDDDRYRRPTIRPVMIPVDRPPPPRDTILSSLIPTSHMIASTDPQYTSNLPLRPLYPRSQYTSTPRVNAGDIIQAASAAEQVFSTLERHRARNESNRKTVGSNPRLTGTDSQGALFPPPYHLHTQPLMNSDGLQSPPNQSSDGSLGLSLPHRVPLSLRNVQLSATSPPDGPGTPPRPRHIVRPTQLQGASPNQSKQSLLPGKTRSALPPLLSNSPEQSPPTATRKTASDTHNIPKSMSTEELTAEMASLEGLMKDLNAITQHEFQC